MAAHTPRWWTFRRATNFSAAMYRCPFCPEPLPALTDHMLIAPEGDTRRRRHAHTACVAEERRSGRLPSWDEWRATQPRRPPWWRRIFGRRA